MVQHDFIVEKLSELGCLQVVELKVEIEAGDGSTNFFLASEEITEVGMGKRLINSDAMVGVVVQHALN